MFSGKSGATSGSVVVSANTTGYFQDEYEQKVKEFQELLVQQDRATAFKMIDDYIDHYRSIGTAYHVEVVKEGLLFYACLAGARALVIYLHTRHHAEVNRISAELVITPLAACLLRPNAEKLKIAEYLLHAGAKTLGTRNPLNPTHFLPQYAHKYAREIWQEDDHLITFLIRNDSVEGVKFLLDHGYDPDNYASNKHHPLVAAAQNPNHACLDLLLPKHKHLFEEDFDGMPAVAYACQRPELVGNIAIFRRAGAEVALMGLPCEGVRFSSPLFVAAHCGNVAALQALVSLQSNIFYLREANKDIYCAVMSGFESDTHTGQPLDTLKAVFAAYQDQKSLPGKFDVLRALYYLISEQLGAQTQKRTAWPDDVYLAMLDYLLSFHPQLNANLNAHLAIAAMGLAPFRFNSFLMECINSPNAPLVYVTLHRLIQAGAKPDVILNVLVESDIDIAQKSKFMELLMHYQVGLANFFTNIPAQATTLPEVFNLVIQLKDRVDFEWASNYINVENTHPHLIGAFLMHALSKRLSQDAFARVANLLNAYIEKYQLSVIRLSPYVKECIRTKNYRFLSVLLKSPACSIAVKMDALYHAMMMRNRDAADRILGTLKMDDGTFYTTFFAHADARGQRDFANDLDNFFFRDRGKTRQLAEVHCRIGAEALKVLIGDRDRTDTALINKDTVYRIDEFRFASEQFALNVLTPFVHLTDLEGNNLLHQLLIDAAESRDLTKIIRALTRVDTASVLEEIDLNQVNEKGQTALTILLSIKPRATEIHDYERILKFLVRGNAERMDAGFAYALENNNTEAAFMLYRMGANVRNEKLLFTCLSKMPELFKWILVHNIPDDLKPRTQLAMKLLEHLYKDKSQTPETRKALAEFIFDNFPAEVSAELVRRGKKQRLSAHTKLEQWITQAVGKDIIDAAYERTRAYDSDAVYSEKFFSQPTGHYQRRFESALAEAKKHPELHQFPSRKSGRH